MILRRNLTGVESDAAYMSALANPSVFDGDRLRPDKMIATAAAMRFDEVPPMVRLGVESEGFLDSAGLEGATEKLFTTPSAIARLWRGPDWSREMVVSAADTADPDDRPLTFTWAILRGDPARITIEPLDATASRARIRVDWHDDYPAPPLKLGVSAPRLTSRIDIGVFADNGANLSAPAFISIAFPTHERRTYGPGPDGEPLLLSVDYDAEIRGAIYDPLLFTTAPWSDRMIYDEAGQLQGWERTTPEGQTRFAADGRTEDGRTVTYTRSEPVGLHVRLDQRIAGD